MFEIYHPVYFLRHYLNTSVFGYLTQAQFPALISRSISNIFSFATAAISCMAVAGACRLKIDREQIHY